MVENVFQKALGISGSGFDMLLGQVQQQIARIDRNKQVKQQFEMQKDLTQHSADVQRKAQLDLITDPKYVTANKDVKTFDTNESIRLWENTQGKAVEAKNKYEQAKFNSENQQEFAKTANERIDKEQQKWRETYGEAISRGFVTARPDFVYDGNSNQVYAKFSGTNANGESVVGFQDLNTLYKQNEPELIRVSLFDNFGKLLADPNIMEADQFNTEATISYDGNIPVKSVGTTTRYGKTSLKQFQQQVLTANPEELEKLRLVFTNVTAATGSQEEVDKRNTLNQKTLGSYNLLKVKVSPNLVKDVNVGSINSKGYEFYDKIRYFFFPDNIKQHVSVSEVLTTLGNSIPNTELSDLTALQKDQIQGLQNNSKDIEKLLQDFYTLNPDVNVDPSDLYFNPYATNGSDIFVNEQRLAALIKKRMTPAEKEAGVIQQSINRSVEADMGIIKKKSPIN